MIKEKIYLLILTLCTASLCFAQEIVPIENYSVNGIGQVQLSIQGNADKYYILEAQHSPTFEWETSLTMGVNGTMVISEPGGAYPEDNYTIWAYDIDSPGDVDGDEIDDLTEFNNMPTDAPLNYAEAIDFIDGSTSIPDADTFLALATVNNVSWAPFLDDQLYVKFGILDRDTPEPKVYFINSNTYTIHASFFNGINADVTGDDSSGEIVFNPTQINPNGVIGGYSFNFSFGDAYNFEDTQRTFELLMANMPFLQNNMNHFIGQADESQHLNNYADDFIGSRIEVALESDVFAEVNYIPFHQAEGYGFFRQMDLEETPGSRDIVLYDALPNSLPRVGGIITSVIQTPLSHVNLRAIQDNVPNAYIQDPLSIDSINNLLGNYIYYKVEEETFQIREATLAEVNDWYEALRPTEEQIPVRDLSITEIMDLDDIQFDMSTAFGAKCTNVATMRTFGFPEGTIPDGYGVPFFFYDEFMIYNNFYEEAEVMINNPSFINDIEFREDRLRDFRDDIKDATMPDWMMDALQEMHDSFPVGTAVRCRSSTNNEDLPGFSGAGLYTSKTQHLDEGHISKSIKQVYASMWNFRAYEERDFYRVDHSQAAMGVLCHPNFQEEKSNGVGISIDPIYETEGTFYLNTQVGESLITNPDPNSVPEEILLYEDPDQGAGYLVLRLSNLVEQGELVMDQIYLDQMREYLGVIHDEFAILYGVEGVEGFGMDIEYKVTAQDQLAIKQARPWVSFWAEIKADNDLSVTDITEPQSSADLGTDELVSIRVANTGLNDMNDFDIELLVEGQSVETINITSAIEPFSDAEYQFTIPQDFSAVGDYLISGIVSDPDDDYNNNDTLHYVLSNVHLVDGALSIYNADAICNGNVAVSAVITNEGAETITSVQIAVTMNGMLVETITEPVNIDFQDMGIVNIVIDENVMENNNISLELVEVNGNSDSDTSNNTASAFAELESDYDVITFYIDADDYPSESSWKIVDVGANQVVSEGALAGGADEYTEEICVNYNSCFTVYFYDSFGDGICCSYGEGHFEVSDYLGEVIIYNNGEFEFDAEESFCLSTNGCEIIADVNVNNTSSTTINDGSIVIGTSSGGSTYQFSIDGGTSFSDSNTFYNLSPGSYDVVISTNNGVCTYQETVEVQACELTLVDIASTDASSVITTDGSIIITPVSGEAPYQYSIDGGQNFSWINAFEGLPVGDYNIVVLDGLGVCEFHIGVPIESLGLVNIDSESELEKAVRLYPNPTDDQINVEITSPSLVEEEVVITVMDFFGRVVDKSLIKQGSSKITISFNGYASGTYFVQCYNKSFKQNFKVIKI